MLVNKTLLQMPESYTAAFICGTDFGAKGAGDYLGNDLQKRGCLVMENLRQRHPDTVENTELLGEALQDGRFFALVAIGPDDDGLVSCEHLEKALRNLRKQCEEQRRSAIALSVLNWSDSVQPTNKTIVRVAHDVFSDSKIEIAICRYDSGLYPVPYMPGRTVQPYSRFSGYFSGYQKRVIGINLGPGMDPRQDSISGICKAFGVNPSGIGVFGRRQTRVPEHLVFRKFTYRGERYSALLMYSESVMGLSEDPRKFGSFIAQKLSLDTAAPKIATAWSSNAFCVCVKHVDERATEAISAVYQAALSKNLVILPDFAPFLNSDFTQVSPSLQPCLLVRDEISPSLAEDIMNYDCRMALLEKVAFTDTNIRNILADAGKQWHTLTAKYGKNETAGSVVYWLVPKGEQYLSGYYTLDELLLWAEDKGPVSSIFRRDTDGF